MLDHSIIIKPETFTLSIDWEDFGQLSSKNIDGILTSPKKAIERQTDILLSMLDDNNVKATFFTSSYEETSQDIDGKVAFETSLDKPKTSTPKE